MRTRLLLLFLILGGTIIVTARAEGAAGHKTKHVIVLMTDGLRWQEVFRGADAALIDTKSEYGPLPEESRRSYWREDIKARREALLPFFWSTMASRGQIYGDRDEGSEVRVTNGLQFSYPGYSETLVGYADTRIHSNDKVPNPNVTVLEWLNGKPAYHGKVAAFGAWDVFPSIFNAERCGFLVNASYDPLLTLPITPEIDLLNRWKLESPRIWKDESFDAVTFYTALTYLKTAKPDVLFLSLGETDEWAHGGSYGEYLTSAHRADAYLKTLWETVQSMPGYRDSTTILFLTDHGRGDGAQWTTHGEKVPEARFIFMAAIGPDTAALGDRGKITGVTQSQTAATIAALLGEDYPASVPKAAPAVTDIVGDGGQVKH